MTRIEEIGRDIQRMKAGAEVKGAGDTMATTALLAIAEVLMEMNTTLTYIKMNMREIARRDRE